MMKASELKKGAVKNIDVKSPSSRGSNTLYKIRFSELRSGQKLDNTYTGDDAFKEVEVLKRAVQFSYQEGDQYIFMDTEDYNQYQLNQSELEEELGYLTESLEGLSAILVDDQMIGLEIPASVNLAIIETAPAIKGASAAARTKPATLATGITVQVPEYLATGEIIKVNTATGKYMSRA